MLRNSLANGVQTRERRPRGGQRLQLCRWSLRKMRIIHLHEHIFSAPDGFEVERTSSDPPLARHLQLLDTFASGGWITGKNEAVSDRWMSGIPWDSTKKGTQEERDTCEGQSNAHEWWGDDRRVLADRTSDTAANAVFGVSRTELSFPIVRHGFGSKRIVYRCFIGIHPSCYYCQARAIQ